MNVKSILRVSLCGLAMGLANCVWIAGTHIHFASCYLASHAQEAAMMGGHGDPRLTMAVVGPVIGVVSGMVIGLFSLAAGKLVKPTSTMETPGL
jgi:hypothetical protein